MSRYVNWADVTNTYPSVAKDRGGEQTSIGLVIDAAEGEVDARLSQKYAVPFVPGSSSAPQMVRTLSIDITYWRLNRQAKWAKQFREDIDATFKALLDGSMGLTNSAGNIDPTLTGGAWASNMHRSAFGPDSPPNWRPSCSEIVDAEDERDAD